MLGKLITTPQQRDAVHVAIAPVIADEDVSPGQHVGFVAKNRVSPAAEKLIGIIDPFLDDNVPADLHCWLVMYPDTITGLRHEWSHPEFEDTAHSVAYVRNAADLCGITYEQLLTDCRNYITGDGWHINMGSNEMYKDVVWSEFWLHFTNITGIETDEDYAPYSCGC